MFQISGYAHFERLDWHQVCVRAVTRPWPTNYETIIRDPYATRTRGIKWILAASLILSFGWNLLLLTVLKRRQPDLFQGNLPVDDIVQLTIIGLVYAVAVTLFVAINAALHFGIARLLGGTGSFDSQLYAETAFTPLCLIFLPFFGLPLLYGLFLSIIAVKAVHQINWMKSIIPVAVSLTLWIGLFLLL